MRAALADAVREVFAGPLRAGNMLPITAWGMNSGDTAWLLVSAALVMLMTPGLALFYGGMVQGKNVLSTFMHSFFALGLVTLQFVVIGYSLCVRHELARRDRRLRLPRPRRVGLDDGRANAAATAPSRTSRSWRTSACSRSSRRR